MSIDAVIDEAMAKAEEHLSSDDAGAAPVPDTAAEAAPAPSAAEPTSSTEQTDTRTAAERARDDAGRYAKEGKRPTGKQNGAKAPPHGVAPTGPTAQGTPAGAQPSLAPAGEPVAPAAPAVKPPASWTPAAREAFAKAPPEVQKEVARRESEMNRAFQETAEARKTAAAVRETLAPFEGLARANGMDSLRYAGSVMQTAATLHMGSPQQKAAVVAQLIGAYGIDVDAVNSMMQGQAPQAAQQAQPPQDVNRLVEQALQQRIGQAVEAQAVSAWEKFQATEPEFLTDSVKDSMRLIIEHEAQRGRKITYEQAYSRACQLDEEVSGVLTQRKAADALRGPQVVTPAARAAAGSARSRPAAAPAAQPKGIDAAMKAAAEKLGI